MIHISGYDFCFTRSECFPIPIMPGDERFTEPCMNFVRSIAGHDDACDFGKSCITLLYNIHVTV